MSDSKKKNGGTVEGNRGRRIEQDKRARVCEELDEGLKKGARQRKICDALGIHP